MSSNPQDNSGAPPPAGQQPPQGGQPWPQQGYGAPPPQGQAPPGQPQQQQQQPYGGWSQGGYPPQQYPQQPWGQPQQQPPAQGGYGAPPPQGFPPQQYGQGPPGQQPYGQQYPAQGQPPFQQQPPYGGPQQYGQQPYPQQQPYPGQGQQPFQQQQPPYGGGTWQQGGAPPQQHVVPVPPSLGYVPGQIATGDASKEADALRKAMKGFGTDEAALIKVLAKPDPLRMALIQQTYIERIGRDLEKDIKSETSGDLETALVGLINGPLGLDVRTLKNSFKGMGTDENALDDVMLGRSNADLKAIKLEYLKVFKKSLESELKSELTGKTERFFIMLNEANRPEPGTWFDPQSVDADVREIHTATEGREGTDEVAVAAIFINAPDAKLVAISEAYERKYRMPLEKVIKDEFSGHLEQALVAMLRRAKDPAGEIADRIWISLGGITPNVKSYDRLLYWLIKLHWDPAQFQAVKTAFHKNHANDLVRMVKNKTAAAQHIGGLIAQLLA